MAVLGCAQVKSPVGGDKDVDAPLVLRWIPDSLPTNFSANKFEMVFDEYIQLNNIAQELVISPPLSSPPKVQLKGRSLSVSWNDTLHANTTYQFNFGNGVADYHEGNKANDLKFVLSTGPVIDSLSVVGTVHDAWTLAPVKASRVLLNEADSGIVMKKPSPRAVAPSNAGGAFLLNFLHAGDYYIAAIDDQNSNYRWDEGEAIDWIDNPISPAYRDSDSVHFFLSVPLAEFVKTPDVKIDSTCRMVYHHKEGDPEVQVRVIDESLIISSPFRSSDDSVSILVLNKSPFDNLRIEFAVAEKKDTISLSLMKEQIGKPLRMSSKVNDKLKKSDSLFVRFNQPIVAIDTSKIRITSGKNFYKPRCGIDSIRKDLVWFISEWKPGDKLSLDCNPQAFKSYQDGVNDTLRIPFAILDKTDLAELVLDLEVKNLEKPMLLLLNKAGNVVDRIDHAYSKTYTFSELLPGEYALLCFDDINENHRWDPANWKAKVHAEPVWRFAPMLQLRANWEVQQKWQISGR